MIYGLCKLVCILTCFSRSLSAEVDAFQTLTAVVEINKDGRVSRGDAQDEQPNEEDRTVTTEVRADGEFGRFQKGPISDPGLSQTEVMADSKKGPISIQKQPNKEDMTVATEVMANGELQQHAESEILVRAVPKERPHHVGNLEVEMKDARWVRDESKERPSDSGNLEVESLVLPQGHVEQATAVENGVGLAQTSVEATSILSRLRANMSFALIAFAVLIVCALGTLAALCYYHHDFRILESSDPEDLRMQTIATSKPLHISNTNSLNSGGLTPTGSRTNEPTSSRTFNPEVPVVPEVPVETQ
jgi:hypothetical protein